MFMLYQKYDDMMTNNLQISKILQQLQSIMKRSCSFLLILTLMFVASVKSETNGTESYFISPAGLGKTTEVTDALQDIAGQIRIKRTTYNRSSITYILDNITIGMGYNDAKQTSEIPKSDLVKISGGRVEFTYRFNYTKIENRNNITGYGYGSVFSDSLTYYKEFSVCPHYYCWRLPLIKPSYEKLTIKDKFKLKRMDPFNQFDLQNIEDMLDSDTAIDPANFKSQILEIFNNIFPLALNDNLEHEILGQNINYTFYSNTHGEMKMNIIHSLYGFGLNSTTGFGVIFVTKIDGFPESRCNITVPREPFDFQITGSTQNFHLHCLYESVVFYLQSNGWLDIVLNSSWESDNFQFYAGDLFDLVSNLQSSFSPRAILDGNCIAQKQGLRFQSVRQFETNSYALSVIYTCSLKGTPREGAPTQILKFNATTKIYIKSEPGAKSLGFKIILGDILNLSFERVGPYTVNNINLAMFKANSVMNNIKNLPTFGTGFPTLTRALPKANVQRDYVLYYDSSTFALNGVQQS